MTSSVFQIISVFFFLGLGYMSKITENCKKKMGGATCTLGTPTSSVISLDTNDKHLHI